MATTKRRRMTTIQHAVEIPRFTSEAEEREFWATHTLSRTVVEQAARAPDDPLPPPSPRTRSIPIRFDGTTIARLKALAAQRGIGYQTLLKEFVIERLYEEEKRSGLIAPGESRR